MRWRLGLAGLIAVAAPAFAYALPRLEAFSQIERGRWQLRGHSGESRSICFDADPTVLIQIEHGGIDCEQDIVADGKAGATVQYNCPGRGFGRTSFRVETPRLARVDTQGLADGRPFFYRTEARRVAAC